MINVQELSHRDIGRWVEYEDAVGRKEKGRIKSWNNKWIFVVYNCDNKWDEFENYTGCATNPRDLIYSHISEIDKA